MESGKAGRTRGARVRHWLSPLRGADRGVAETLAKMGALEVRLAASSLEVRAAQKLRYRVFFEQGGASGRPDR